jgi:mannitol/fructose-specific phosphotransferase system IIA component (Ntr-type)
MELDDFLGPSPLVVDLRGKDCWEAIEELIDNLVTAGKIKPEHREAVLAAVRKRELSMSTGVGSGIGIPHAATEHVSEVVTIVGRSPDGLAFNAIDDQPVHVVLLYLVPSGKLQQHLNTLATLARLLRGPGVRHRLQNGIT